MLSGGSVSYPGEATGGVLPHSLVVPLDLTVHVTEVRPNQEQTLRRSDT